MATKKISALASGTPAQATDKIPIARGSANYYLTPDDLSTYIGGGGGGGYTEGCGVNGATQSIANNSAQDVVFGSADSYDTDTMHDPGGANPERITCVTDGTYLFIFFGSFAANATGTRYAALYKNNATLFDFMRYTPFTGVPTPLKTTMLIPLVAGDYVTVKVFQDSGGALNLTSGYCAVQRVG